MVKYIYTTCLLCTCLVSAIAQMSENATTIQQLNLKGKIKTVYAVSGDDTLKTYFDKHGRVIEEYRQYSLFNMSCKRDSYVYDSKNQLISYNEHCVGLNNTSDKNANTATTTHYQYTYDDRGQLTQLLYASDGEEARVLYKYEYNKQGYVERIAGTEGAMCRKYNAQKQVVEEWYKYPESTIRANMTDPDTGQQFDEVSVIEGYTSPSIIFAYNQQGNEISRKQQTDEGVWRTDIITYQYDDKGNWVEKKHSDYIEGFGDEFEGESITRLIEYYP